MRKLFGQKSKNKPQHHHTTSTLTATTSGSLVIIPTPTPPPPPPAAASLKDDDLPLMSKNQQNTHSTNMMNTSLPQSTDEDIFLPTTELNDEDDGEETAVEDGDKSKKLFVVVSDVDSSCAPPPLIPSSSETDSHLLSVDERETIDPVTNINLAQISARKRSSTGSGTHLVRYREQQNTKKFVEERLRRRSWMVSQAQLPLSSTTMMMGTLPIMNNSLPPQSPDILLHHQQQQQHTNNLLRIRRLRLGQSEPNLNSLQMNYLYQNSTSLKCSPRTSSANSHCSTLQSSSSSTTPLTSQHHFPFPLRRPSSRRSNLSGLNLINLKYALRKQLSPQQQQQPQQQTTSCANASEPPVQPEINPANKSTFNPSSTSAFKPISDDSSNRRWSLTSAPSSSGYGSTTPITCHSHESSQYSSVERLQHQQQPPSSHPTPTCTCRSTPTTSKQQMIATTTSSNEGSLSSVNNGMLTHDDVLYGSLQRLESRSLSMSLLDANLSSSSPCKMLTPMLMMTDHDINAMAYVYKERYPKAKVQMEERLQNFIDAHKSVDKYDYSSDGSARFIHNQILELAKDCLEKSQDDLITTMYFNEMTDNLERLLSNAKEKCPQSISNLQTVVRSLLLTTARPARLLECLEFDPEDFLRTLDEVECQAKSIGNIKQDIPKYICSKLNLERNPLDVIDRLQQTTEESTELPDNQALSESETDSISDTNYLTITPNTTFPPIESSSSLLPTNRPPCEEDFEVIKLVSNGAYGAVHLIKHRQTHERYAMKKISKTHLILRNQVEQAFVERDIMTFTDNPFVVALICTFETKKHLCLVMEYVEGGDVATLLKNIGGPLNIDIARMYFAETTLAVEYLHSYGIIHRDLKPDNLLITAVGHIKLTDFGLSKIGLMSLTTNFYEKHIDKETKAFNDKQICGTPSYIAPEVILRQGYGKPVDWWSMGIILYEFLIGIPPFTGNTPDELFANVINGQIEWPDVLDDSISDMSSSAIYDSSEQMFCPEAKNLIEQLLDHDPSTRLGTLGGAHEIRSHPFCACINWNSLLREKADFVPVLESPDDTSYFDTREDRYQHSDDDILSTTNKQTQVSSNIPTVDNESDALFASFSSVSLKYVSELSGSQNLKSTNGKLHRQSSKQQQDSTTTNTTASELSSADVSRANSCSECFNPDNVIRIGSPSGFQPLVMTQSMPSETTESAVVQKTLGSDTFEPLLVSSDESSEPISTKTKSTPIDHSSDKLLLPCETLSRKNSSSSSSLSSSHKATITTNTGEKKIQAITTSTPATTTKHHKQRKTSIKLLEQQNANDSGDDVQQQKGKSRHHHKKGRVPRTLSPLKPKPSLILPTQTSSPQVSVSSYSTSQSVTSFDIVQSISAVPTTTTTATTITVSPTSSSQPPIVSISTLEEQTTANDKLDLNKSASSNALKVVPASSSQPPPNTKPVTYNNSNNQQQQQQHQQQQRSFPRSLSKSFSSSSSSCSPPPPVWMSNQDDRCYRQNQRQNMAVSPLERDTTLKAQQQSSFSSSTMSPLHSMTNNLRPPIIIRRGPRSFGFTLRAVKVFHGNTDYYTTQHVVVAVEGPAQEAGLRPNDVITHVNERPVAGLLHPEVVKLILSGSPKLSIRAVPCAETQIRTGGRRRSPSKQKIRYQQNNYDKKTQTHGDHHYHPHQPHCQKYRTHSSASISSSNPSGSGSSSGGGCSSSSNTNNNKKHPQNNSLFRRLSERKVARDIEAAAAAQAAGATSLAIPTATTTLANTNPISSSTNNNNSTVLSSSLPLLLFSQSSHEMHHNHHHHPSILDSSEWPPLQPPLKPPTPTEPDSPQPTLLPSIVRTRPQISVSPLARCPPSTTVAGNTSSSGHQPLCKTVSEPPLLSRHSHSSSSHHQLSSTPIYEEINAQNYYYAPMASSHRKKYHYHKSALPPPPPFVLADHPQSNHLHYFDFAQSCPQSDLFNNATRSSSTESSSSSTSTVKHVDNLSSSSSSPSSSTPVVVATKFFYRRR